MSDLIPDGWANESIGTYVDKMVGGAPLRPDDFSKAGVRVIPKKAVQFGGKTKFNVKTYCTSDFASNNLKNIVNNEYIITSLRDLVPTGPTIGVIGKLEEQGEFILAQGVYGLKTKNIIDDYLIQLSNSQWYRQEMRLIFVGSTQVHIRNQEFLDVVVPIPPLPEQQKIAAILTSVDKVIEKTQAQIDKLKDLKTGMMQELLTVGVGIDGTPHTEFKASPVGRVPKGWEVLPLSKIAKLERGKFSHRPRNDPKFYNGDIPFLQTGDIPKKSPYIKKFSQTLNEKGLGVSKLFPVGTLVITIAATIGEIGVLEFESCFPDSLVGIKVNSSKADSMYVLYVMRHLKCELDLLAPQTAQKNINLDILSPFNIPVPPLSEQVQISKALESIDHRLNILDHKLTTIQNTKKALMQDLLTGKVRVKPMPSSLSASSLTAN